MEVDSLSHRITNAQQAYYNTTHIGLRKRLLNESKKIFLRICEIFSIAKLLKNRTKENISFSSLLLEKCERTITQKRMDINLFFL